MSESTDLHGILLANELQGNDCPVRHTVSSPVIVKLPHTAIPPAVPGTAAIVSLCGSRGTVRGMNSIEVDGVAEVKTGLSVGGRGGMGCVVAKMC